MSIQLPTQSRLQVAKVGFVTGDLPFREVLSVKLLACFRAYASNAMSPSHLQGSISGPWLAVTGAGFTPANVHPQTGVPDVMRGEETQIIGALPVTGRHVAVLPGTHSKWAWVEDGAIVSFASFMTGEVYAALTQHTILGRLMKLDAPHNAAAFERGVRYGIDAPAQLLNRLFSARTLGLFEQLSAEALPSYLSGLLIGSEIGGARMIGGQVDAVTVIGSAALSANYANACIAAAINVTQGASDSAWLGIQAIRASLR